MHKAASLSLPAQWLRIFLIALLIPVLFAQTQTAQINGLVTDATGVSRAE